MSGSAGGPIGSDGRLDGGSDGIEGSNVGVDTRTAVPGDIPKRSRGPYRPRAGSGGNERERSAERPAPAAGAAPKEKLPRKNAVSALDLSGIESALIGIHLGIAKLSGSEIWELDKKEAEVGAAAIKNVAQHYPNFAASQKTVDWILLIQAIGMIYGPRIAMAKMMRDDKARERQKGASNVSQFPAST